MLKRVEYNGNKTDGIFALLRKKEKDINEYNESTLCTICDNIGTHTKGGNTH